MKSEGGKTSSKSRRIFKAREYIVEIDIQAHFTIRDYIEPPRRFINRERSLSIIHRFQVINPGPWGRGGTGRNRDKSFKHQCDSASSRTLWNRIRYLGKAEGAEN